MKIDLYYVNVWKHKHEDNLKGYGAKLCLKLMLNKLKEMKGPIPIYIPVGT
jgi:hypothetical protein